MEVTYLYYPKEKIFSILPMALSKRGYYISDKEDDQFRMKICKKRFFFKNYCVGISLADEVNNTTKIVINDPVHPSQSKFVHTILQEIFRIF